MKFMKRVLLAIVSGGVLVASSVMAQEAPKAPREETSKEAKPEGLPSREEIRKELEALPPEQRQARLAEIREKMKNSPEMQKLREELKNMPPEQREAKMKELREKYGQPGAGPEAGKMREKYGKGEGAGELEKRREEFKNLTPEQRETKMKEMREKFAERRTDLEKKKANGTITPEESKQLERIEAMAKRGEKAREEKPKSE